MKPALLSFRIIVAILAIASAQIATAGEGTERERIALKYNNPDLTVDLGVGLWGIPLPTDWNGDGLTDLVVSCPDKPYKGLYLFINIGTQDEPLFDRAVKISDRGLNNIKLSQVDGRSYVMSKGAEYPDFFKAAVSCAGNHDNRIYNRWWSETHHGVKEVVSEQGDTTFSYKIATNPEIAARLKGHLLLVHGDIDNNVHPANTLRVVNALIRAGKRFDMLILPGQRHGFGDMDEYFYGRQETSVALPRR